MTGSHSGIGEELLRAQERQLDVTADLEHCEPFLQDAVHANQAELLLPRFERELHVADQHCPRAVEHARVLAEDAFHGEDEVGGAVHDHLLHRSRSGTVSKPIARSSAWPTRKSMFSENCGPTSWRPTGNPSERPQGMFNPGSPAMHDGIVSRSERYMASGFSVRAPRGKATVGDVGDTSTSKRSNAAACSRAITVRTFCACP